MYVCIYYIYIIYIIYILYIYYIYTYSFLNIAHVYHIRNRNMIQNTWRDVKNFLGTFRATRGS
jgi:hypothetical protein